MLTRIESLNIDAKGNSPHSYEYPTVSMANGAMKPIAQNGFIIRIFMKSHMGEVFPPMELRQPVEFYASSSGFVSTLLIGKGIEVIFVNRGFE